MSNSNNIPDHIYTTRLQRPPGKIVAPHGFPTDPRPKNAPKVFLDAMDIRIKVFCDEQRCAIEPELDEDDPRSFSWVVYQGPISADPGDVGEPVSTIRIVPPPHAPHPNGFVDPHEAPYVKLTRVATLSHARGKGLNKKLIREALGWLAEHPDEVGGGWDGLVLTHAQCVIEGFYGKMGFVTDDRLGRWDEEGIEHLGMWKTLDIRRP